MTRIFKPFAFLVAAIYFLVDAAFWMIARPVARLLADHWVFDRLRTWIISLGPYPTLALFVVPVLVLEPAKPVAAYLTATGHVVSGLAILGVAEILKLMLIERLFRISRDKLMSIPAFAWGYGKFGQARNWVESRSAWQLMRRLSLSAQHAVRRYVLDIRASRKRERLSWQSR
ncbi:hypothetical protein SAMN05443247_05474 [Bradyrhizobium erythrophlei]|nr:hypothetical protein SAMN05443247_05474 [Bradyrhizobium erythrophlei]